MCYCPNQLGLKFQMLKFRLFNQPCGYESNSLSEKFQQNKLLLFIRF